MITLYDTDGHIYISFYISRLQWLQMRDPNFEKIFACSYTHNKLNVLSRVVKHYFPSPSSGWTGLQIYVLLSKVIHTYPTYLSTYMLMAGQTTCAIESCPPPCTDWHFDRNWAQDKKALVAEKTEKAENQSKILLKLLLYNVRTKMFIAGCV